MRLLGISAFTIQLVQYRYSRGRLTIAGLSLIISTLANKLLIPLSQPYHQPQLLHPGGQLHFFHHLVQALALVVQDAVHGTIKQQ